MNALKRKLALFFYCTVLFNSVLSLADAPAHNTTKATSMHANETARITPLLPSDWNDEIMDALGAFPSSRNFVLSRWDEASDDKRGQNVLGFLAHYPALAKAFLTLNKHVAADTLLTTRDKEIVILRTTWLIKADNEFAQHIILGRRAGLNDAELQGVQQSDIGAMWNKNDTALIRASDELHADSRISDSTFEQLLSQYDNKQIMDIIFLAGSYRILGSAANSFNIPLDGGIEDRDPLIPAFIDSSRK